MGLLLLGGSYCACPQVLQGICPSHVACGVVAIRRPQDASVFATQAPHHRCDPTKPIGVMSEPLPNPSTCVPYHVKVCFALRVGVWGALGEGTWGVEHGAMQASSGTDGPWFCYWARMFDAGAGSTHVRYWSGRYTCAPVAEHVCYWVSTVATGSALLLLGHDGC